MSRRQTLDKRIVTELSIGRQDVFAPPGTGATCLSQVVDAIGSESFGSSLVHFLHELCGADHIACYHLASESISTLARSSFDANEPSTPFVERYVTMGWRLDPTLALARRTSRAQTSMIHVDIDDQGYSAIRANVYSNVRDRVVLYGHRGECDLSLSVLRTSEGPFPVSAFERLSSVSETLLSAAAKHMHMHVLVHRPNIAAALTGLTEIESCFAARSELPRRELEVCARVLYGLSSIGIALDLGLGEESVKTYRKRAYRRMNIGCERELLHWYLTQWSEWRGCLNVPSGHGLH